MEDTIWIYSKSPLKLFLDEYSISWTTPKKFFTFAWLEVIGSKLLTDCNKLSLLVFNKSKLEFETFDFTYKDHSLAAQTFKKIKDNTQTLPRKAAVFVNPISGSGKSFKVYSETLCKVLSYSDLEHTLFEITSPVYFKTFDPESISLYSDLVVLGGDGTLHQLLTALSKQSSLISQFNFSIIPTGTQNALAFELYGKSVNSSIFSMVKGKPIACDLLKVALDDRETIATTAVTWGLISDITQRADHLRSIGNLRFGLTGFCRFFQSWSPYVCELSNDEKTETGHFGCVFFGNHSVKSFNGKEIVFPRGDLHDGKIDVMTLDFLSRWGTVSFFNQMRKAGEHLNNGRLKYWKEKKICIRAVNYFVFNVDGEIYEARNVSVESMQSAIKFLVA